jgi:hypothetical protein
MAEDVTFRDLDGGVTRVGLSMMGMEMQGLARQG